MAEQEAGHSLGGAPLLRDRQAGNGGSGLAPELRINYWRDSKSVLFHFCQHNKRSELTDPNT